MAKITVNIKGGAIKKLDEGIITISTAMSEELKKINKSMTSGWVGKNLSDYPALWNFLKVKNDSSDISYSWIIFREKAAFLYNGFDPPLDNHLLFDKKSETLYGKIYLIADYKRFAYEVYTDGELTETVFNPGAVSADNEIVAKNDGCLDGGRYMKSVILPWEHDGRWESWGGLYASVGEKYIIFYTRLESDRSYARDTDTDKMVLIRNNNKGGVTYNTCELSSGSYIGQKLTYSDIVINKVKESYSDTLTKELDNLQCYVFKADVGVEIYLDFYGNKIDKQVSGQEPIFDKPNILAVPENTSMEAVVETGTKTTFDEEDITNSIGAGGTVDENTNIDYQKQLSKLSKAHEIRTDISNKGNLTDSECREAFQELNKDDDGNYTKTDDDYDKEVLKIDNKNINTPTSVTQVNPTIINKSNTLQNINKAIPPTDKQSDIFSDIIGGLGNFGDLKSLLTDVSGIMGVMGLLSKFFKLDLKQVEKLNDTSEISNTNIEKYIPGVATGALDNIKIPTNFRKPNLPEIPINADDPTKEIANISENKAVISSLKIQECGNTPDIADLNIQPELPKLNEYIPAKPKELDIYNPLDEITSKLPEIPESSSNIIGSGNFPVLFNGDIQINNISITLNLKKEGDGIYAKLNGKVHITLKSNSNLEYDGLYGKDDVELNLTQFDSDITKYKVRGSIVVERKSGDLGLEFITFYINGNYNSSFGILNVPNRTVEIAVYAPGSGGLQMKAGQNITLTGNYVQ